MLSGGSMVNNDYDKRYHVGAPFPYVKNRLALYGLKGQRSKLLLYYCGMLYFECKPHHSLCVLLSSYSYGNFYTVFRLLPGA